MAKKKKNLSGSAREDEIRRQEGNSRDVGRTTTITLKGDKIIIGTITICIIDIKGKNYVICATGQDIFRPTALGDMTG